MSTIRMRPTFRLTSNLSNRVALKQLQSDVAHGSQDISGKFKGHHAVLSIVGSKRHFWSPWLSLEFCDSKNGCVILGRFSPHPSIWTGFAFSYSAIGVLIFFSAIVGMSQQLASQPPFGYYSIPVLILLGILLWCASQVGQKLAMKQMILLKEIVVDSLDKSPSQAR